MNDNDVFITYQISDSLYYIYYFLLLVVKDSKFMLLCSKSNVK